MATRKALQVGDKVQLTNPAIETAYCSGIFGFDGNTGTIIHIDITTATAEIEWNKPFGRYGCHRGNHHVHKLQKVKRQGSRHSLDPETDTYNNRKFNEDGSFTIIGE